MASTDGSENVEAQAEAVERVAKASDDPEVLAAEIERTREELAETLDAIADKVSPKRVAKRTTKKVADAVKGGAEQVKEQATSAAGTVKEQAASAASSVKDTASAAKDTAAAKVGSNGSAESSAVDLDADPETTLTTTSELRFAGASGSTSLAPYGAAPSPLADRRLLAFGAAAFVAALLLLRRRR